MDKNPVQDVGTIETDGEIKEHIGNHILKCKRIIISVVILMINLKTVVQADELKSFINPIRSPSQSALSVPHASKQYHVESTYERLKKVYALGKHEEARGQAIIYLKDHPTDGDTRLLLGQIYFDNREYSKAGAQLSEVLKQTPRYIDARLVLINVEMELHHYQKALAIVKVGLLLTPNNEDLLIKRKKIRITIKDKNNNMKIKKIPAHMNLNKINQKNYLNELGIFQQEYYISDVKKTWDYTTVYYARETPVGKVYGKANYAERFSRKAVQGEIEAYPRLNKFIYLDLDVAFADEPNLFPNQVYGAEAFFSIRKPFDFSVGGKYNSVDKNHLFYVLTGSISKDIRNNRFTLRSYHYVPGVGKTSTLFILDFRHIIEDPLYYIGVLIGAGTSPDLADLTTVNFIVVNNKIISPYIKIPFHNKRLIISLNGLYQNQIFPLNGVRDWSGGTIGIAWRF